jgi:hypothetical protein
MTEKLIAGQFIIWFRLLPSQLLFLALAQPQEGMQVSKRLPEQDLEHQEDRQVRQDQKY